MALQIGDAEPTLQRVARERAELEREVQELLRVRLGNYTSPGVGAQANAALMLQVAWRFFGATKIGPCGEVWFYRGASEGIGDAWLEMQWKKLSTAYLLTLLDELQTEVYVMREVRRYLR